MNRRVGTRTICGFRTGAQEIIAVDVDGRSEVAVRVPFALPFCIDWLPDGRQLIVSGREGLLMRREPDGSLVTHADLRSLSDQGLERDHR